MKTRTIEYAGLDSLMPERWSHCDRFRCRDRVLGSVPCDWSENLTTLAGLHALMEWSETALRDNIKFRSWRKRMLAGPDVLVML